MLGFSTNSIQFKIWRSQLTTLFVLMILLIIANFTVFQGLRDRLVYEQLEHAIEARNEYDGFDSERDDFLKSDPKSKSKVDNGAWTPHFAINWLDESPTLIVDQFTGEAYMNDARYNIPLMILSNITEDGKDRGKLSLDSSQVHYLTHNMDDGSQMVYFHVSATYSFFRMEYLIVALLLGVMGFFTSALAAKKISRPI